MCTIMSTKGSQHRLIRPRPCCPLAPLLQVMAKQFEVMRTVATLCPAFSKHDAYVGICGKPSWPPGPGICIIIARNTVKTFQYEVVVPCLGCSMYTQPPGQFSHALPPTPLTCTTGAIEKLADLKLKGPAVELLLALSEAVGPQFVAVQLHKKAAAHKNPKVGMWC